MRNAVGLRFNLPLIQYHILTRSLLSWEATKQEAYLARDDLDCLFELEKSLETTSFTHTCLVARTPLSRLYRNNRQLVSGVQGYKRPLRPHCMLRGP